MLIQNGTCGYSTHPIKNIIINLQDKAMNVIRTQKIHTVIYPFWDAQRPYHQSIIIQFPPINPSMLKICISAKPEWWISTTLYLCCALPRARERSHISLLLPCSQFLWLLSFLMSAKNLQWYASMARIANIWDLFFKGFGPGSDVALDFWGVSWASLGCFSPPPTSLLLVVPFKQRIYRPTPRVH